jgi:acyl-ACP thioesterase
MVEKRSVFTVATYHCNREGALQLHSLMHQLQEVASRHAEELGVGRKWMEREGFYWVLVNFKMDILKHPMYGETVILKTWPSGWDMLKAFRDFQGEDLKGNILFRATSDWMVIDRKTLTPRTTKELHFDFPSSQDRNIRDMVRKKPLPDMVEVSRIRVPYSAIDMNGHVNNTEYVRWGVDGLRASYFTDREIDGFTISFIAEVFQDEELVISRKDMGDGRVLISGSKGEGGKTAFAMEFDLSN